MKKAVLIIVILSLLGFAAFWSSKNAEAPISNEPIVLTTPKDGDIITSPLTISGYARGFWFFEGDFPVILVDWDGKIIAESYATAQLLEGETWMTEDFIPFKGVIEFSARGGSASGGERPSGDTDFAKRGALILQKDNPSGISQYDDALEVPILFE